MVVVVVVAVVRVRVIVVVWVDVVHEWHIIGQVCRTLAAISRVSAVASWQLISVATKHSTGSIAPLQYALEDVVVDVLVGVTVVVRVVVLVLVHVLHMTGHSFRNRLATSERM